MSVSLSDFAHGSSFQEPSVVAAYKHRPTYPDETFDLLLSLIAPEGPRRVLDIGCGTGLIARPLAARLDHVDAVDISAGMIAEGKREAGGARANLNWIVSAAETAPLSPPYGLATAGDAIGWMDWRAVLPKLADALAPNALFAMLACRTLDPPWHADLLALIKRYSTMPNFRPIDAPAELTAYGVFEPRGRHTTAPVIQTQSLDDYIESFHGRSTFARERMKPGRRPRLRRRHPHAPPRARHDQPADRRRHRLGTADVSL